MVMGAVRGVFLALERMGKSNGGNGGRIINVASVAGLTVGLSCSGVSMKQLFRRSF